MKEFIIQINDADQRVDKFIQKAVPMLPKSLLYKSIRNKKIKVNRKRCEGSQRLQCGDRVQCFLAEAFFDTAHTYSFLKVPTQVDYIYEDEQIALLIKPSGLLSHNDRKDVQDNLADRLLHDLYQRGQYDPQQEQSFAPALCHRLDRNTQGIVIAAKTAAALRAMNAHIRRHEIKKQYLCIVEGIPRRQEALLTLWHQKDKHNIAHISPSEKKDHQKTITGYRTLATKKGYALLEVDLHTGKSHQIRAVMAYLQHPLYGDVKYGAKKNGKTQYQALCAYQISFAFSQDDIFSYLNGRTFTLRDNDVTKLFASL